MISRTDNGSSGDRSGDTVPLQKCIAQKEGLWKGAQQRPKDALQPKASVVQREQGMPICSASQCWVINYSPVQQSKAMTFLKIMLMDSGGDTFGQGMMRKSPICLSWRPVKDKGDTEWELGSYGDLFVHTFCSNETELPVKSLQGAWDSSQHRDLPWPVRASIMTWRGSKFRPSVETSTGCK